MSTKMQLIIRTTGCFSHHHTSELRGFELASVAARVCLVFAFFASAETRSLKDVPEATAFLMEAHPFFFVPSAGAADVGVLEVDMALASKGSPLLALEDAAEEEMALIKRSEETR